MPSNLQYTELSTKTEKELAQRVASFRYDPYGFVMFNWPWGVKGSPLEHKTGPNRWQTEHLKALGEFTVENAIRKQHFDLDYKVWRSAIASGHGVGKSAEVAWLIYWLMSTRMNARGSVTANTGVQLETKTWPELAKWHAMALNRHWFTWTSTSFFFAQYPPDKQKTYMTNAITVSDENTEGFAGLHNEQSAVFAIFDEAGGITSNVWEVVQGALTDGEPFFFVKGNPTRSEGEFFDCFHKNKELYNFLRHVDSREVEHTNKEQLNDIIKLYGADSDEAKVRVYGQFPSRSFNGFISLSVVNDAATRPIVPDYGAALVMGVDVAAQGDDASVICFRQGWDARSIGWEKHFGMNEQFLAKRIAELANKYRPDAIFLENIGPSVAVNALLKSWGYRVVEVQPGAPAPRDSVFYNVRAQIWSDMRQWLHDGGAIPNDPQLFSDLTQITYSIEGGAAGSRQRQIMEPKKQMRARGLKSPDHADSLALTFAHTIARRDMVVGNRVRQQQLATMEYDELAT